MIRQATATNNGMLFNSRRLDRALFGLIILGLVFSASVALINAQRVYGVGAVRRTTVVSNGSTAVVRRTTVVGGAGGGAVVRTGHIYSLPGGYRAVGGGYYMAGGIRYRAQFYQGRTVYVRV